MRMDIQFLLLLESNIKRIFATGNLDYMICILQLFWMKFSSL